MDIATFEKLANEHGLVPMRITESFAPWGRGDVAGFHPGEALRLYERKAAIPAAARLDVEASAPGLLAAPDAPSAPKGNPAVVIPENWEALHHLQIIRLAKEIRGTSEPLGKEEAYEIVRSEIERRGSHA